MPRQYATFDEFFLHYLRQHRQARNRLLHAFGTGLGLVVVAASFALHHPWFALLFLPLGYGFAWIGHLLIERNKPATWSYPWWSFVSDFRMLALMLAGRLDSWMEKADRQVPVSDSEELPESKKAIASKPLAKPAAR